MAFFVRKEVEESRVVVVVVVDDFQRSSVVELLLPRSESNFLFRSIMGFVGWVLVVFACIF